MKKVHLFPSIVQEVFFPNILLLHWHSAGTHHPVGRLSFLDSLEPWEPNNTEAFFCTYFLSHFRHQNLRPITSVLEKAHHTVTESGFSSVSYTSFGVHFSRFCNFACLLIQIEKACIHRRKHSFLGTLDHFLAPFDNIEQNSSFSFYDLPVAM